MREIRFVDIYELRLNPKQIDFIKDKFHLSDENPFLFFQMPSLKEAEMFEEREDEDSETWTYILYKLTDVDLNWGENFILDIRWEGDYGSKKFPTVPDFIRAVQQEQ